MSKKFTISIAGCHQGQNKKGVEYGFTPFLSALHHVMSNDEYQKNVIDFRSDEYFTDPIYGSHILGNNIFTNTIKDSTLITFGGDHTISYGTIIAAKKLYHNLKVIWIDAHPDINTPTSSLSGNCHGMPVSYLFGISKDPRLEEVYIDPKDFAYIGVRCLDNFEKNLLEELKKKGLLVYTADDVIKNGIKNITKDIKKKWNLENKKYKFHVSLDVDSMDPVYIPSTGTPVDNGISPSDVSYLLSWANHNSINKMSNLDITEVNPLLSDIGGICKTYSTINKILKRYLYIY